MTDQVTSTKIEIEKLKIEKMKLFYLAYLAELARLESIRRNRSWLDKIEESIFDW